MDRWILGDLHILIKKVTAELDGYDAFAAGRAIADFVDELSNWYVRRSRRRFWKSEADADKIAAYLTLNECLVTVAKLLAPFTPFLAEELYQNLVAERSPEAPESVHLVDWPVADEALIDEDLSFRMAVARQVVNLGRAARNASQIKTRQPVEVAVVACRRQASAAAVESLAAVVAEELNVKSIEFVESASELVSYVVKPNYRTLGPKFGKNMPAVAAAVAALPADETGDKLARAAARCHRSTVAGGRRPMAPRPRVRVRPRGLRRGDPRARGLQGGARRRHGRGHLDGRCRRSWCSEGLARELVHHIQNTRKAADFQIDDRIHLRVTGPAEVAEMLAVHGDWVKKETLAVSLEATLAGDGGSGGRRGSWRGRAAGAYSEALKVNGLPVTVEVWKA